MREIAAHYSPATMRIAARCFAWLWPRLYDDIRIYHLEAVKRLEDGCEIIYLPTHRSHLDYLLLSSFLHDQQLGVPHVAAGINLNLPLVGSLLRRCGAFFLRRSFKGELLYSAVFNEYLHHLQTQGVPLEYFIEGGRSRSGFLLPPKTGLLGMSVSSFLREHTRPLAFVPIYIGYEKLFEGETYLRELSGVPKQKESLWGLLQTLRRIRKVYGQVHVSFGEPLFLADFLATCRPGWQEVAPDCVPDWSRAVTPQLAAALATRINEAAVIGPVNLMALVLLASREPILGSAMLCRVIEHYLALAEAVPYAATSVSCPRDAQQIIRITQRLGYIEQRAGQVRIAAAQAGLLAYFRNNVVHLFVLPALIAALLLEHGSLPETQLIALLTQRYASLRDQLFLRHADHEIAAQCVRLIALLQGRLLLQKQAGSQMLALPAECQSMAELALIGNALPALTH